MAFSSRILAVDLGGSAVRLLEIGPDAQGRPVVLAASEEEIPQDPAKTSEFFPIYAQALTAALGKLPSKTRACHLCLGGPAVFARLIKVPAADPGKVESMVGFEAQQTVPAIEQALWGHQLLAPSQAKELEALILAIKKETVEELSAAAVAAGLKPMTCTLAPAALLNSFYFNYPETAGAILLLEIGARATTVLLVEESRIFVRVVPLGGGTVSQAVAADLQESFAGAELLKRAKGFVHPGGAYADPADPAAERISKLARGVLTRLYGEVERSVAFFRSQQGGGKPASVLLAGGGAMLGYTDLFFREKLKVPVDYFQPFRRLSLAQPAGMPGLVKNFPAWGVVVGTGLQALSDAPIRINVLGTSAQTRAETEKDRPARNLMLTMVALLALLSVVHFFWQAHKAGELLSGESLRVEEAERALQALQADHKKFLAATESLQLAIALEKERIRWPSLLQELRDQSQPRLWITGLKAVPGNEGRKESPSVEKTKGPLPLRVEIRGMFETRSEKADAEAVEKFTQALNQGKVLENVTVLEREAPKYVDGKTDQVALKFRLQADWPESKSGQPKVKETAR